MFCRSQVCLNEFGSTKTKAKRPTFHETNQTEWFNFCNDKFDVCLSLATLNIKVCWIAKQVLLVRLRSILGDEHGRHQVNMPIKCLYYLGPGGGYSPRYLCATLKGFAWFWTENECRLWSFWSGIGYGFRGHYGSVRTCFSSKLIRKKKKYANPNGLHCCCCNLSNDDIIS